MRSTLPVAAAILAAATTLTAAGRSIAAAAPTIVEIRDMKYNPATLTIAPGTTVTWVNEDNQPHTVTDRTHVFRSAALDTKERFSFTFTSPGEFTYYCTIHQMMVGRIIVRPAGGAT